VELSSHLSGFCRFFFDFYKFLSFNGFLMVL
jgi:hypothetical protein